MAALTTAQEYALIREAIQIFSTTSQTVASFQLGEMSVTYQSNQMDWLQTRERELAKRMTTRNLRKRTISAFN